MRTIPLQANALLALLERGENTDLEYKSARGGVPASLWESYSAMANTDGGVLVLGVSDNGVPHGVADPAKTRKALWDTLNDAGKVSRNLLTNDDLRSIEIGGNTLFLLQVPRASHAERPIYIGQNPLTGCYRRNFEGDYHCDEREVKRMLADQSEQSADEQILVGYSLADLDGDSVQQYRNLFSAAYPDHPWLGESTQDLLAKLRAWRRDRSSGEEGITVAGLLMFGTHDALRETLPQFHVDFRERLSTDSEQRWSDRVVPDGTWPGNLFQFYRRVFPKITLGLKTPFAYQEGGELLRKGESAVHEALRETLVNALIHADHQGSGGVVVERYVDRFEFSNPGASLLSRDQIFAGGVSECRNKVLQTLFTMIGSAEKAGSGIDKIKRGWASQHWRTPELEERFGPDRVIWRLRMVTLLPPEALQQLEKCFGTRFQALGELEVQALVTAQIEDRVDNSRLQQVSNQHPVDITQRLAALVDSGFLKREGRGRGSWYQLAADSQKRSLPNNEHGLLHREGGLPHSEPDLPHKEQNLLHNDASPALQAESRQGNLALHSEDENDPYLPEIDHNSEISQWQKLEQIAAARRRPRMNIEDTTSLILELCQLKWLSKRQIAQLLKKNANGLGYRFLSPMSEKGLLQLRFPTSPSRPDQAYRTTPDQSLNAESDDL